MLLTPSWGNPIFSLSGSTSEGLIWEINTEIKQWLGWQGLGLPTMPATRPLYLQPKFWHVHICSEIQGKGQTRRLSSITCTGGKLLQTEETIQTVVNGRRMLGQSCAVCLLATPALLDSRGEKKKRKKKQNRYFVFTKACLSHVWRQVNSRSVRTVGSPNIGYVNLTIRAMSGSTLYILLSVLIAYWLKVAQYSSKHWTAFSIALRVRFSVATLLVT